MELIVLKGQGLDVCSLLNCALMAYAYLLYFTLLTYHMGILITLNYASVDMKF